MIDYSENSLSQWVKQSGVLGATKVKAYQLKHHLSDGEILVIVKDFLLAARQSSNEFSLNLHGFKQYYFYSYILNQFDRLAGKNT